MASANKSGTPSSPNEVLNPKPKLIAFLCKWCSGNASDLAGVSRMQYPANVVPIRVNCSGRIDPQFVLEAFEDGADGVLVSGCHLGDCHYVVGNYKTFKRVEMIKVLAAQMGIDTKRIRLEWISASEAKKFADTIVDFVGELKRMPPHDGGEA